MKVEYPKYNEKQDGRIKITSEIAEEMQSLRREGHAVTWLAKHYGISLSTVVYHTDERQRDKILTRPEKPCLSSEHEPATMKYRDGGVYKHTCPDCGEETIFTVPQTHQTKTTFLLSS